MDRLRCQKGITSTYVLPTCVYTSPLGIAFRVNRETGYGVMLGFCWGLQNMHVVVRPHSERYVLVRACRHSNHHNEAERWLSSGPMQTLGMAHSDLGRAVSGIGPQAETALLLTHSLKQCIRLIPSLRKHMVRIQSKVAYNRFEQCSSTTRCTHSEHLSFFSTNLILAAMAGGYERSRDGWTNWE